jgi:type VI secretion system protein ImpJ
MMFAKEIPEAIQWHEGMLLTPQHFQQNAARFELLLQYTSLLASPFCWGVRSLMLDGKALPSGMIRVERLEALLPDGTLIDYDSESRKELSINLAARADEARLSPIAIYAVLPDRESNQSQGSLERYESWEGGTVIDENTGDGELRIPRVRPRIALMAGAVPPAKYVSLPIAQVSLRDESFVLTDYVAPCQFVTARSPLGTSVSAVLRRVREKAMYLAEKLRGPSAAVTRPIWRDTQDQVRALVACLPYCEAMLASGAATPFSLYMGLCALAGSLATLGASVIPPVFPPYNHRDLLASFSIVISFCERMIDEGIPESYSVFPFELKDRMFHLLFSGDWATKRLVVGMRVAVGATERDTIGWGEESLIGSASVMPSLREKRILGAGRTYLDRDEDLAPGRGVVLFSLRCDAEFIRSGEILQIFNANEKNYARRPSEIVLFIKLKDRTAG